MAMISVFAVAFSMLLHSATTALPVFDNSSVSQNTHKEACTNALWSEHSKRETISDIGTECYRFDHVIDGIPRAEHMMKEFYTILRSYVNETNFDHHRFQLHFEGLNNTLVEIGNFIESLQSANDFLYFSKNFAGNCLGVMRIVQENMTLAERNDEPYYRLFYDASELRVLILDKFNLSGVFDFDSPYFEDCVDRLNNKLLALKGRYINIEFIPMQMRLMVWNHIVHADTMLQILESYLVPPRTL